MKPTNARGNCTVGIGNTQILRGKNERKDQVNKQENAQRTKGLAHVATQGNAQGTNGENARGNAQGTWGGVVERRPDRWLGWSVTEPVGQSVARSVGRSISQPVSQSVNLSPTTHTDISLTEVHPSNKH